MYRSSTNTRKQQSASAKVSVKTTGVDAETCKASNRHPASELQNRKNEKTQKNQKLNLKKRNFQFSSSII